MGLAILVVVGESIEPDSPVRMGLPLGLSRMEEKRDFFGGLPSILEALRQDKMLDEGLSSIVAKLGLVKFEVVLETVVLREISESCDIVQ